MAHLDPAQSLVLVVDVQEKLAPAMPEPQLAQVLRASSVLLEAARVLGVRALATEQYPKGLGATLGPVADKLASVGAKIVAKDTFSAADEPLFLRALHAPRPKHVIVLGMEAHICVFQTARDLCSLGFDVHVPLDGVASRRDDHREAGLRLCEKSGATITTAETVAFDWLGRAGTDAFKAVSRAVR